MSSGLKSPRQWRACSDVPDSHQTLVQQMLTWGSSLVAQWIKEPWWLHWLSLVWWGFDPQPRNFHMSRAQPKKKRERERARKRCWPEFSKDLQSPFLQFAHFSLLCSCPSFPVPQSSFHHWCVKSFMLKVLPSVLYVCTTVFLLPQVGIYSLTLGFLKI